MACLLGDGARRRTASGAGARGPGSGPVQRGVEAEGRVDEGEVGERLRGVPELLAGEADLLGEETEVGGVGQYLLEHQPGLVQPPGAREGIDVGERAQREGALRATQTVR